MEAGAAGPQEPTPADVTPVGATSDAPQGGPSTPVDAGQEAPSDAEQTGVGIVVICGQFEPGSIVKLYKVNSDRDLRVEGNEVVGQRIVDYNEEVGFSGLEPGQRYIAAGYSRGRYEEVRCVGHDPDDEVALLQPPLQQSPITLGTQQTPILDAPAAQSEAASDLGVGLPVGVTSPLLSDRTTEASPQAGADATVTPGDIEGALVGDAATQALSDREPGQTADEHLAQEAAALQAQQDAEAKAAEAADEVKAAQDAQDAADTAEAEQKALTEREEAEAAQAKADGEAKAAAEQVEASAKAAQEAAPVDESNPPAPDAGTPDASESSGTGQANGGADEQEPKTTGGVTTSVEATSTLPGGVTFEGGGSSSETSPPATPSEPADTPVEQTPSDAAPEPQAVEEQADPDTAPPEPPAASVTASPQQQLVAQAEGLGIENAATLSEAELRQAITEKNVTPVV